MSTPKLLKIGNNTYKVKYIYDDETSDYGSFDRRRQILRVNSTDSPIDIVDTLIHEILHGIYEHFKLKPEDDEERVVSAIAAGLTQVFQDNKHLMKYIQGLIVANGKESNTPLEGGT